MDLFGNLPHVTIHAGFEEWWQAFPRKTAKIDARRAWDQVMKKGGVSAEFLVTQALRYNAAVQLKDPQFVCHGSTWLRQGRWSEQDVEHEERAAHAAIVGTTTAERRGHERHGRLLRYHAATVGDTDGRD